MLKDLWLDSIGLGFAVLRTGCDFKNGSFLHPYGKGRRSRVWVIGCAGHEHWGASLRGGTCAGG